MAVYEAVQAGDDGLANTLVLIISTVCVLVLLMANRLAPGHQAYQQGRS